MAIAKDDAGGGLCDFREEKFAREAHGESREVTV